MRNSTCRRSARRSRGAPPGSGRSGNACSGNAPNNPAVSPIPEPRKPPPCAVHDEPIRNAREFRARANSFTGSEPGPIDLHPGCRSGTRPVLRPSWHDATVGAAVANGSTWLCRPPRPAGRVPFGIWMNGLLAIHGHWKSTTVIGGLTSRGFIAPYVLDGAMDGPTFKAPPRPAGRVPSRDRIKGLLALDGPSSCWLPSSCPATSSSLQGLLALSPPEIG